MENKKVIQGQVNTEAMQVDKIAGETMLVTAEEIQAIFKEACLVIVAGGNGTRLFPISYDLCPKQFCRLNKTDTFIQDSIKRFIDCGIDPKRIIIYVTNKRQYELALDQVLGLGVIEPNVLLMPEIHDFGGAMPVADDFVKEKFGDVVTIHTPADQYVVKGEAFKQAVTELVISAKDNPTLLGVYKSDLVTVMGSGNIRFADGTASIRKVEGFVEKPEKPDAEKILREGNTVVNSGICAWRPSHVPQQFVHLEGALKTDELMNAFMDSGTLDVVIGQFPWYDCGTLDSFWAISKKTPNHENASLHAEDGHIYRYECRKSLFATINGVDIYAANVMDAAVVVNKVREKLAICVVAKPSSQKVRFLAEDFTTNREILEHHFVLDGTNNKVSRTNCADEIYAGFVGVSDYSVTVIKTPESRYIVSVSRDTMPDPTNE